MDTKQYKIDVSCSGTKNEIAKSLISLAKTIKNETHEVLSNSEWEENDLVVFTEEITNE